MKHWLYEIIMLVADVAFFSLVLAAGLAALFGLGWCAFKMGDAFGTPGFAAVPCLAGGAYLTVAFRRHKRQQQ